MILNIDLVEGLWSIELQSCKW